MKKKVFLFQLIISLTIFAVFLACDDGLEGGCNGAPNSLDNGMMLTPRNGLNNVNTDVRLRIEFRSAPPLGNQGKIRVYDASNDNLVDELDLSIPPGPKNNRTRAPYDTLTYSSVPDKVYTVNDPDTDPTHVYQQNYIGGQTESDAYHFFPVLIDKNTATICLHSNSLEYNRTYYVQIDPEVFPFSDGGFKGIYGKTDWTFTTKTAPPAANSSRIVVSADGMGDFDTVQGAVDSTPDNNSTPKIIFIKNGIYEEIVYFRNKKNLSIIGEDREKVVIRYANNGVFNPSAGHNRRAVFATDKATDVNLINFTLLSMGKEENPAQAEALLIKGDRCQVHNVTMLGSGDCLQANGNIYLSHSSLRGYGDNVLSYGALFFNNCDLISTYGPHLWPRNPQTNHGLVFVNSTFRLVGEGTTGDGHADIARSPTNHGIDYPYAEAVLINCKLAGIRPEGWGPACPDARNVHFWEYNSVNLSDGSPVDVSRRVSWSRQLTMAHDSQIIADYSNPAYVLGGWEPALPPDVLAQLPDTINVSFGK